MGEDLPTVDEELPETVHTPERRLADHLARLRGAGGDLRRARSLALRRLAHDWRARYLSSRLGLPLAFVPALVVTLWATLAHRAEILKVGGLALPYPAWVFLSVTLWQAFAEALHLQVDGLAAERTLLAKVDVPPEAAILARAGEAILQLLLKLLLGLLLAQAFAIALPATVAWLPLAALPLVLLGTACGLWLAPLAALSPDAARLLPAITTAGFFLTPVVFPVPAEGAFRILVLTNPVTPLVGFARDLAIAGIVSHPFGASGATLLGLLLLPTGWVFYRLALPYVLERTGV
jgi:lipopolysaccharide transport system permease protein